MMRCPKCARDHNIMTDILVCSCGHKIDHSGEMEDAIIDLLPYSKRSKQKGVLRITDFPKFKASKACVVGKGPSADDWKKVDADVFLTINEAVYLVNRACYCVRGDGNRATHRFMEWLPAYATPIMPARLRDFYNYGWYFLWEDIKLPTICLTTLMAIRLAYHLFDPDEIICCGLDALHKPSMDRYHPDLGNPRNIQHGMGDQRPRVKKLEPEIYKRCKHFDGDELVVDYVT